MKRSPTRRTGRAAGVVLTLAGCLVAAGCAGGPDPAGPGATATAPTSAASSAPTGSAAASTPDPNTLTIAITISGGSVTPNGQKIDARVGQQVDLRVTSDSDDEIHAHTGGDGYELEVAAGKTTTGSFTLDSAGSFEVESHHLEKTIVILNAR